MAKADDLNWMVPLRRVVVKTKLLYSELMQLWEQKQMRDSDGMRAMLAWYDDAEAEGKPFVPTDYVRGLAELRRWREVTFEGPTKAQTSAVGKTTLQTFVPNFHARLWKGPKRVLLEQAAKDDHDELAKIQPFDLERGRIAPWRDEQGTTRDFELYVGDVLEVPIHEFLAACGQLRFKDIEFDPKGSFYLGTSIRSRSHKERTELPRIHDNMQAMRFQLVMALNFANCYHDKPVYTEAYLSKVSDLQVKPEGGGVYARGMPYGGNATSPLKTKPTRWSVSQVNTNIPSSSMPVYMPDIDSLHRYAPDLPVTWGWTCSPFMLFFFNYMLDLRETKDGRWFPSDFRSGSSFAATATLSAAASSNATMLAKVRLFQCPESWDEWKAKKLDLDDVKEEQADLCKSPDPLLTWNLERSDVILSPRENSPIADYFEICLPANEPRPANRFYARATLIEIPKHDEEPEAPKEEEGKKGKKSKKGKKGKKKPPPVSEHKLDDLCPDACMISISSGGGHEFSIVKLYSAWQIITDARDMEGKAEPPVAGRMAAYHPLTGADLRDGHEGEHTYFTNESSAYLLPLVVKDQDGDDLFNRAQYTRLQLSEARIHKFKPVLDNSLRFTVNKIQKLLVDDDGGSFRTKPVSSIFFVTEGHLSGDPRAIHDIYEAPRTSWPPIELRLPSSKPDPQVKALLADFDKLYATRAVPFPTILEIEDGMPSRERVEQQLGNHKRRILDLLKPGVREAIEDSIEEIDSNSNLSDDEKKSATRKMQHDINIIRNEFLRNALLLLLP